MSDHDYYFIFKRNGKVTIHIKACNKFVAKQKMRERFGDYWTKSFSKEEIAAKFQ